MIFDHHWLAAQLPKAERYCVALSGGLDSTVLLHALLKISSLPVKSVFVVHIDHGIQAISKQWAQKCFQLCQQWQVDCQIITLVCAAKAGESLEAIARQYRYQALAGKIKPGDCLLTAHHQDDQAETLLLQLLRGSGIQGMSAMPAIKPFAEGVLARPLLQFSRDSLHDYAIQHQLTWIEDPSNEVVQFDRNFIRHQVLPLIKTRWPAAQKTITRSAHHCAQAQVLIDEQAKSLLVTVKGEQNTLRVSLLKQLSEPLKKSVIRYWIKQSHYILPSEVHLNRITHEILNARHDRMPMVNWNHAEIRRFQDQIYIMKPVCEPDAGWVVRWDIHQPLILPAQLGVLSIIETTGSGILKTNAEITVSFRQGGERMTPVGKKHHHLLKKLFQEAAIPVWQRALIPLIYIDGQLAAVADMWIDDAFVCEEGGSGFNLVWEGI